MWSLQRDGLWVDCPGQSQLYAVHVAGMHRKLTHAAMWGRVQRYQVPIYGSPGQVPAGGVPVGAPYQQAAYPPQYEQPGYPQKV